MNLSSQEVIKWQRGTDLLESIDLLEWSRSLHERLVSLLSLISKDALDVDYALTSPDILNRVLWVLTANPLIKPLEEYIKTLDGIDNSILSDCDRMYDLLTAPNCTSLMVTCIFRCLTEWKQWEDLKQIYCWLILRTRRAQNPLTYNRILELVTASASKLWLNLSN